MPRAYCEYSNNLLLTLADQGDFEAANERLIREIMWIEKLDWDGAKLKAQEMQQSTQHFSDYLMTLPFKVLAAALVTSGVASIPLCFDLSTAIWFNDAYVTTDVPDDEDLETFLEVGGWTWNWMEPPLGQLSFVLLSVELFRRSLDHLGVKPWIGYVKAKRTARIVNQYTQYNRRIVAQFADNAPLR